MYTVFITHHPLIKACGNHIAGSRHVALNTGRSLPTAHDLLSLPAKRQTLCARVIAHAGSGPLSTQRFGTVPSSGERSELVVVAESEVVGGGGGGE